MANELAAALTNHDRVRRSTDIPLFFGKKGKDTVTPQQLIERLEKAAGIAGWATPKRKTDEFYMCLREGAMSWFNTLDNIIGFDKESWDDVKSESETLKIETLSRTHHFVIILVFINNS